MSYRDTYLYPRCYQRQVPYYYDSSLFPRSHSYCAANEQRVGSYLRTLMSLGSSSSSVRSSIGASHSQPSYEFNIGPSPDVSEVYPRLYVGDAVAAQNKAFLKRMGINYVLNTAEGKRFTQVDTDHLYYRDVPGLRYKGFQMMDLPTTDISKYFYVAANFIDEGLSSGGRVLVHCFMGVSRSATCALAFLMIKRGMSLTEAISTVRSRRDIHPNPGFMRQLQQLDRELRQYRAR